jgi:hypothetical protein
VGFVDAPHPLLLLVTATRLHVLSVDGEGGATPQLDLLPPPDPPLVFRNMATGPGIVAVMVSPKPPSTRPATEPSQVL